MAKETTYKSVNEFLKITFPSSYQDKKPPKDIAQESITKRNSEDFKMRISNILRNEKAQTAPNKR